MTGLLARIALSLALTLASLTGVARAHSKDEATLPVDGAVLKSAPETIGMTFDRPMRVTLIILTDANGDEHDLSRTDNMQPVTSFEAAPAPLPAGSYTIEWRGLSADGHPMQGSFSFQIEG